MRESLMTGGQTKLIMKLISFSYCQSCPHAFVIQTPLNSTIQTPLNSAYINLKKKTLGHLRIKSLIVSHFGFGGVTLGLIVTVPSHCQLFTYENFILDSVICQSEYRCLQSSICLPQHYLCDGFPQCPLGDDERLCNYT